jgi:hypothetical protein
MGQMHGIITTLETMAEAHCGRGDTGAARSCLLEAVEICRRTGDQACLNGLGRLAHLSGDPEKAVRLLATATALRPDDAAAGAPGWVGWEDRLAALKRELRAAMSGETFDSAEAAGSEMTWDQAIAYALGERA